MCISVIHAPGTNVNYRFNGPEKYLEIEKVLTFEVSRAQIEKFHPDYGLTYIH